VQRLAILLAATLLTSRQAFCGGGEFVATVANKTPPLEKSPEGMVWIPGGEFSMGAAVNGEGSHEMPMASNDAGPVHRVRVDGFCM
jgi:formylglycine-generating enzyme required for sulfatase activity